jgi:hypothetical protein
VVDHYMWAMDSPGQQAYWRRCMAGGSRRAPGVLYHMEDPLRALRRVAAVTSQLAVVETEAIVVPGLESEALWRFFPAAELNGDVSNWWAPNATALHGALRAAGFDRAATVAGPPRELLEAPGGPHHHRLTGHGARGGGAREAQAG